MIGERRVRPDSVPPAEAHWACRINCELVVHFIHGHVLVGAPDDILHLYVGEFGRHNHAGLIGRRRTGGSGRAVLTLPATRQNKKTG